MEAFIAYFGTAILAVLSGLTAYLKTKSERKESAKVRDNDSQVIHDTLLHHEWQIKQLESSDNAIVRRLDALQEQMTALNTNVIKIAASIDSLNKAFERHLQEFDKLKESK